MRRTCIDSGSLQCSTMCRLYKQLPQSDFTTRLLARVFLQRRYIVTIVVFNPMMHIIHFYLGDCEWSDWSIGSCSENCGGGTRTNTRTVEKEATHGGKSCDGPSTIDEPCNIQQCKGYNRLI